MNKKLVFEVLDDIASRQQEAVAIVDRDSRRLTYARLKESSSALAVRLGEQVSVAGQVIGVFLPESAAYIISIIGIGKAGGIFLPLNPDYPEERLKTLLAFIRPGAYITSPSFKDRLLELLILAGLDTDVPILTDVEGLDPVMAQNWVQPGLSGEESYYLLYTSGSTGEPKVIEGVHKGLSHFIHWEMATFGLDQQVKTALLAPISFDVSLRDIFVPLLAGGTVFIPAREIKADPSSLLQWIADSRINLLHIVPSIFRLFIQFLETQAEPAPYISGLKHLLLAGEPLYFRDVHGWQKIAGDQAELVNLYGPTETTLAKLFYRIPASVTEPSVLARIVPLGKPISNTMALILKDNKIAQIGEIGEICIKTPFRSKGYYRNPGMTAMKFRQNPLHEDYEDIIYCTGDLGRYLADRSIEFVGRQDSQIKVRGNRVELSEVEGVLQQVTGIGQCLVIPIHKSDHEIVLACYYTGTEGIASSAVAYLSRFLPDYMLPSFFIRLDAFPLGLNGKIDRKALPLPEEVLYDKLEYIPPSDELEALLCRIWSEVLGIRKIGVSNSFFELGGHSLNAVKVVSGIYTHTGKQVPLKEFFDLPTIRLLAEKLRGLEQSAIDPILPLPLSGHYGVSHAQKRLLMLDLAGPGLYAYNMVGTWKFTRSFDEHAFGKAFGAIVSRHESLRTSFMTVNGEFRQKVNQQPDFKLEWLDLSGSADPAVIDQLIQREIHYSFDLSGEILLRATLIKLGAEEYVFILNLNHIAGDGWSMRLIVHELLTFYAAFTGNLPDAQAPLALQYKDYAAWQNERLAAGKWDHQKQYWHRRLSDVPEPFQLPIDYARPSGVHFEGANYPFSLDRDESARLERLAAEHHVGIFALLLSVIKVVLYVNSGTSDILVGIPSAGRNHPALDNQVGLYLNNLVIRSAIDRNTAFSQFIRHTQAVIAGALENQDYPFDRLVEELGTGRGPSGNPFYTVLVVMNNNGLNADKEDVKGLEEAFGIQPYSFRPDISKLDLSFFLTEEDPIQVDLEYNTQLFKKATIIKIARDFRQVIQSIGTNIHLTIGDLGWQLSDKDRESALKSKTGIISEDF